MNARATTHVRSFILITALLAACSDDDPAVSADKPFAALRSKCQAKPTQLITEDDLFPPELHADSLGISAAVDLVASDTDLYVAVAYDDELGALLRVPISGGKASLMTRILGSEQSLIIAGDSVVFALAHRAGGDSTGEIVRMGLQGGKTTVLAEAQIPRASIYGPNGILASDGHTVYFATLDGVKSVPLAGGATRDVSPHTGSLALVGSDLIIADADAHTVFRLAVTAPSDPTTLATDLPQVLGPVVSCGDAVCWASGVPLPMASGTASITRLDDEGNATTLADGKGLFAVYRLLFDDDEFYLSTLGDISAGDVLRLPASGGEPELAGFGSGVAIDAECLYTASALRGVYSLKKDVRLQP